MSLSLRCTAPLGAALIVAGCASNAPAEFSPPAFADQPKQAPSLGAASGERQTTAPYVIGAGDTLQVTVFQVPDLSMSQAKVDAVGNIQMPLIGTIRVAGATADQLARDLEQRLAQGFLRTPRATVTVIEAASGKVTVDGAVTKPGVYELRGRTTLLQAVAMAEGPNNTADLRRVAVFRQSEGRRMAAVFDLVEIRSGRAIDPVIEGDDIVVVNTSRLSKAMREVLAALPGIAVFGYF